MRGGSKGLKRTLHQSGYSDTAISAAWPAWWSDDAEGSPSAQAELRFSLARKLGLDPRSLLEDDEPLWVWKGNSKFKRLTSESEAEQAIISSFGVSVGRMLVAAAGTPRAIEGVPAAQLRNTILEKQPFVRLLDLLGLSWALGIPVIHLRVFPLAAKRMSAMAVRVGSQFAVLLGRDADYPAPIAYYLAHELGHIALGHIKDETATIVDLSDPLEEARRSDPEEKEADRYALELLTGDPEPVVATDAKHFTADQLAQNAVDTGTSLKVEPGTLVLCFGHSTSQWAKATAAMRRIYDQPRPVWSEINRTTDQQLDWTTLPRDVEAFLRIVMRGEIE